MAFNGYVKIPYEATESPEKYAREAGEHFASTHTKSGECIGVFGTKKKTIEDKLRDEIMSKVDDATKDARESRRMVFFGNGEMVLCEWRRGQLQYSWIRKDSPCGGGGTIFGGNDDKIRNVRDMVAYVREHHAEMNGGITGETVVL